MRSSIQNTVAGWMQVCRTRLFLWQVQWTVSSADSIKTPLTDSTAMDGANNAAVSHVICAGRRGRHERQPSASHCVTDGRTRYRRIAGQSMHARTAGASKLPCSASQSPSPPLHPSVLPPPVLEIGWRVLSDRWRCMDFARPLSSAVSSGQRPNGRPTIMLDKVKIKARRSAHLVYRNRYCIRALAEMLSDKCQRTGSCRWSQTNQPTNTARQKNNLIDWSR